VGSARRGRLRTELDACRQVTDVLWI